MKSLITLGLLLILSCKNEKVVNESETIETNKTEQTNLLPDYKALILKDSTYIAKGFDFPVGKPNAMGYYNAQKFQVNHHLGEDWNGTRGGNTDLGDPIYAIANGYVKEVKDYEGGWGNIVRVVHLYNGDLFESLYVHCDSMLVKTDTFIKKGKQIATIGNCNGIYLAHLHFEIRDKVNMDIGGGYSTDTSDYLNPTEFINKHR